MSRPCPFCTIPIERLFHVGTHVAGLWDAFPVNPGHALLITKRHVANWFDATEAERQELVAATVLAQQAILARDATRPPDGFNLGVNVGEAAGQTVPHLHLHVIPRYHGDTPDPRGGVRLAVPERGNYLANAKGTQSETPLFGVAPHRRPVITGADDDPLLPHLLAHLNRTSRVDVAVAFVLARGVAALAGHLGELLERGGRLRLLTGDYLDATDPEALVQLQDLRDAFPEQVALRVYEARQRSFHPKTYILESPDGDGIAFIGSSNLSEAALTRGVEWSYRIVSTREGDAYRLAKQAFEALFADPATVELTRTWIEEYRKRRPRPYPLPRLPLQPGAAAADHAPAPEEPVELEAEPLAPATPNPVQEEALAALAQTRAEGNGAGLVVMATGLGKTWLAAFDVARFGGRALFVAHREEILRQAHRTFRRVMPDARLGFYDGRDKDPDADVLFASVQTLSRPEHLERFSADRFAHLTIDEFHHAHAGTYRRLLEHFTPRFLLGLTATPERTDGGDLLALCGENLVFRADLFEGIERKLLVPFHYFGVPDEVEYDQIPWRSGRFSEAELTAAVATERRAQNAYEQLQRHGGERVLAFCVSIRHAEFMARWFQDRGLRAAAVHTGPDAIPRQEAVQRLAAGDLQVLCTVDMFNEGVDIPEVDTVLMLRPTESKVLWLQQIGRGLRLAKGKDRLRIVDYVGNHRTFLRGVEALFGLEANTLTLRKQIAALRKQDGEADLPGGCHITYELEALDLLERLARVGKRADAFRQWAEDFRDRHGRRPTPLEAYHEGFDPGRLPKSLGGWWQALAALNLLTGAETTLLGDAAAAALLSAIGRTRMSRTYKMVLLLAWIESGRFPGSIQVDELTQAFRKVALRTGPIALDVTADLDDARALRRLLVENPIRYLVGEGADAEGLLAFDDDTLHVAFDLSAEHRPLLRELLREIAEWRLAAHLQNTRADRRQQIVTDEGRVLDARFTTERVEDGAFGVVLESRGGARGSGQERNTEYKEGLWVLLGRLKGLGAVIERVELATRMVSGEVLALEGYGYPVRLAEVEDVAALGKAIQGAQGNNPTRRIRMVVAGVAASVRHLHARLGRARAVSIDQGAG